MLLEERMLGQSFGLLKSNNAITGSRRPFPIFSNTSKLGALIPLSIRLRKSTEMPTSSANSSCVSFAFQADRLKALPELCPETGHAWGCNPPRTVVV